jgi:hypothetical protein
MGEGYHDLMLEWKVLGMKTLPVAIQDNWEGQLRVRSARKKDKERFLAMLDSADIYYFFDTIREIHTFLIKLPVETTDDDLAFFEGFIMRIKRSSKDPLVSLEGEEQNSVIIITADKERDDYEARQEKREERAVAREASMKEMEMTSRKKMGIH